jgi:hypothetical protein
MTSKIHIQFIRLDVDFLLVWYDLVVYSFLLFKFL